MGLNKRQSANYLRIKEGKLYLGTDKECKDPYDEITGTIKGFSFKEDEFEGQKIRKLVVKIESDGENYLLSFPFDSSYTTTLVSFLKNADLSRTVTLVPSLKKEGDKTRRALLVSQDGTFMKHFYTKDNPNGLPQMKQKRNGKWDKDDMMDFIEDVITKEFMPAVNGDVSDAEPTRATPKVMVESDDSSDDLPF